MNKTTDFKDVLEVNYVYDGKVDYAVTRNLPEAEAVVQRIHELITDNEHDDPDNPQTIGVISPFRAQVELIKHSIMQVLSDSVIRKYKIEVGTAHTFQGDERDIMVLSWAIAGNSHSQSLTFLQRPNLFNVAITRARASLIVVGNKSYCQNSNIHYLASFANYTASLNTHVNDNVLPRFGREYPDVKTIDFVSEWERQLYTALYGKGLHTIPQYEVDKYHIDLALIDGNKKLAIEVGEETEYNSEQSYAIHLRNTRLIELGWKIIRFQPYQIRDDMEWCVNQVCYM